MTTSRNKRPYLGIALNYGGQYGALSVVGRCRCDRSEVPNVLVLGAVTSEYPLYSPDRGLAKNGLRSRMDGSAHEPQRETFFVFLGSSHDNLLSTPYPKTDFCEKLK